MFLSSGDYEVPPLPRPAHQSVFGKLAPCTAQGVRKSARRVFWRPGVKCASRHAESELLPSKADIACGEREKRGREGASEE